MIPVELTTGEKEYIMTKRDTIIERRVNELPKTIVLDINGVWSRITVDVRVVHRERVIVTNIDDGDIVLDVKIGDTFRISNEVRDWEVICNEKGFIEFVKYGNDGHILRTTTVRPGKYLMARTSPEVRHGMFHKIKPMPLSKIFEGSSKECKVIAYEAVKATPIDVTINGCGLYWLDAESLEFPNVLGGKSAIETAKLYSRWYPFIKLEDGTFKPLNIIESPREEEWTYSGTSKLLAQEWCHNFIVSDIKSKDNKFAIAPWGSMLSLYVNNNIK